MAAKTDDDAVLSSLSPRLPTALAAANKRLYHKLTSADILGAMHVVGVAQPGTCLLLQPRPLPDSCGTGTVPVAFVVRLADQVHIRLRRAAQGYGRRHKTPAVWAELRQFPRGDTATKLARWSAAEDCISIPITAVMSIKPKQPACSLELWTVST